MLWRVPGSIPCSRSGRGETTLAKLGTDTRLEEHVVCCRCGCWKNRRCSSWLSMYLTSTCLLVEFLPVHLCAFSALMLFVGWQEGHLACENEWWGAGMVICLERGADLHTVQPSWCRCHSLSRFSKTQISFTYLVPAHPGSPGKGPLNVCVCVRACMRACVCVCKKLVTTALHLPARRYVSAVSASLY